MTIKTGYAKTNYPSIQQVNIRSSATTQISTNIVARVPVGTQVMVYEDVLEKKGQWTFYLVRTTDGDYGLMRHDVLTFAVLLQDEPKPPPAAALGFNTGVNVDRPAFDTGVNIDPARSDSKPTAEELKGFGYVRLVWKDVHQAFNPIDVYIPLLQSYTAAGITSVIVLTHESLPKAVADTYWHTAITQPETTDTQTWDSYTVAFGEVAQELATQLLQHGIDFIFQIGNEPDLKGVDTGIYIPSHRYGDLLTVCAYMLKGADTSIRVATAGLASGDELGYLSRLGNVTWSNIDYLGVHFYLRDAVGQPFAAFGKLTDIQAYVDFVNDHKLKVLITEWGTPDGEEAAVTQYFQRFTRAMARYAAISGIIQFAWRHRQHNDMYGVLHDDGIHLAIKQALLPPKSISITTPSKQIGKRLAVNYQSQWDADARTHSGDCGVTCIEMLIRTRGTDMSTDDLYARYLPDKPAGKYTLGWELMHVLRAQGFSNEDRSYNTNPLPELREAIDQDKVVIALVNYRYINQYIQTLGYDNNFTGAHWFLVVGYDDDHMLVHDPNFGLDQLRAEPYRGKSPRKVGAYLKLPNAIFRKAWANPNTGNNPWFGIEVEL